MMFIKTILFCQFLCLLGFIHGQSSDSADDVACSDQWVRIHRGCYMFVTEEEPWSTALEYCRSIGGDLTTIQSWKEKEEIQKHLATEITDTPKWWVGLKRNKTTTGPWKWIDNNDLDSNVVPWSNPSLRERPGEFCGYVDMATTKLQFTVTKCSVSHPFICEYHSILPRSEPVTESTTTTATTETTTTSEPTDAPPQTTVGCSCGDSADVLSSDAGESPENRLRRRNQALTVDEELYQRYLQSEIDANNAKVVYYSEVARYYQEALDAQNKYYSSQRQKTDLEIIKLQEGTTCA